MGRRGTQFRGAGGRVDGHAGGAGVDKLGPYPLNSIITGDAKILAERIPDDSVDLIFTDPVYQNIEDYQWLAKTAARVLKPSGDVLVYLGMYHLDKILMQMTRHLNFRWLLVSKKMSSGTLIWSYSLFSHFLPLLWFTKGSPRNGPFRIDFKWKPPEGNKVNHNWSKGAKDASYWIAKFSLPSDVIWEPFCGGGAILEALTGLGRDWLAFEINPETAELARRRVANTQPPLPGLLVDQLSFQEMAL